MADDFNKLAVLIEANTKSYERAMAKLQSSTNAAFNKIERQSSKLDGTFARMSGSIGRIGAALAAGLSIGAAVRFADAFTRIENSLKTTGLAGAELAKVQGRLYQIAQDNAVSWEALAGLYSKVSLVQKELGVSSADLLNFTDNVSKALRVSGTTATQASGALMQLSQALGSGTVRAEEFNSILEGAPAIARAAAAGLKEAGGSVAALKQLVIDGKVSSDVFFRAFQEGAKALDGQLKNTEVTVSSAFQKLSDALTKSVGEFDNATGASNVFAESLNLIAETINSIDWDAAISGYQRYARETRKYGLQIRNMFTEMFGGEGDYSFLPQVSGGEAESPGTPRNIGVPNNFTFGGSKVTPISVTSGKTSGKGISKDKKENPWAGFGFSEETINSAESMNVQLDAIADRNAELKQSFSSLTSGIVNGFMSGKTAVERMSNALDNVAGQLMDAGINALISGLTGGMGRSAGGFDPWTGLRTLTGRAVGGPVSAGKPYMVGENGPELFIPSAAGKVASNQNMGGMGGAVFNIDARGAQAGVGEEIRRALADYDRQSLARHVANHQQARKRRAI
jgi:tape measure domain-containing protein